MAARRSSSRRPRRRKGKKPVRDTLGHTLSYRGQLVHHFKKAAPQQESILAAFEATGWPPSIEVAVLAASGLRTKKQLRETVKNLSRSVRPFLRFHQEGAGGRIRGESI
jgi:hypothetical protein